MQEQAAAHLMLDNATTTVASEAFQLGANNKTFHIEGATTAGAGSASVSIEVSNNTDWPWLELATTTLTLGTAMAADGMAMEAGWKFVRARITAISGTGANVSVALGI